MNFCDQKQTYDRAIRSEKTGEHRTSNTARSAVIPLILTPAELTIGRGSPDGLFLKLTYALCEQYRGQESCWERQYPVLFPGEPSSSPGTDLRLEQPPLASRSASTSSSSLHRSTAEDSGCSQDDNLPDKLHVQKDRGRVVSRRTDQKEVL